MSDKFEPVILGFLCNWCAYAGGDLAGVSRLQYPPNMRVIRTMCSGWCIPGWWWTPWIEGSTASLSWGDTWATVITWMVITKHWHGVKQLN